MRFRLIFLILLSALAFSQVKKGSGGVPELFILPKHEKNFDKLITWLKSSEMFRDEKNLIMALQGAFNAAKDNDYERYSAWLKVLDEEMKRLDDKKRTEFIKFIQRLKSGKEAKN